MNDPFDRELTISCGAALFNLRAAAAHAEHDVDVTLLPSGPDDSDVLARVDVRRGTGAAPLARLAHNIEGRHSTREPFGSSEMSPAIERELIDAAAREGARLWFIAGGARRVLAALIAEGDRLQFADPNWRRELASWMHPRRSGDGLATAPIVAPVSRLVVRHFDLGQRIGASDESLALEAPALAVLSTGSDTVEDWLAAGQALERALLVAAGHGFQAGHLNQPCQVEQLRGRLAELATPGQTPQLVLRLGVPSARRHPSVRRPIADVVAE